MSIGTAVPSKEQMDKVKHYFIQTKSVTEYYTAGLYELEALELIESLFARGHDTLVMTGGSMFYIDAICSGMADVPSANMSLRKTLTERLKTEGVHSLADELRHLDPIAYETIDRLNGMRVLRALEVCMDTGKPYSSFKREAPKERTFEIEKIGLIRPRSVLYDRINARVSSMMNEGLIEEVRSLTEFKNLTALQTVGYKEVFNYLENPDTVSFEETVSLIQSNTRHYAKRQLTWWRRDGAINWINL